MKPISNDAREPGSLHHIVRPPSVKPAAVCQTCGGEIQMGKLMVSTGTGFDCATCSYFHEANYWRKKYREARRPNDPSSATAERKLMKTTEGNNGGSLERMVSQPTCESCIHFDARPGSNHGSCKNPPVGKNWPLLSKDDWCENHTPRLANDRTEPQAKL